MPVVSVVNRSDILLPIQAMKSGAVEFFSRLFDERALIDAMHNATNSNKAAQRSQNAIVAVLLQYRAISEK